MIIKLADHFNPTNDKQLKQAAPSFTPNDKKSIVSKFHTASIKSNAPFIADAKQKPVSGIPKTKWWKKMEKAQLN